MKKIAFIFYGKSTIVEQYHTILEKHFEVVPVRFDCLAKVYDIYKAAKHADVSFCWLADVWSFVAVPVAKLFKKKSIVVVGGYEVECIKEINYGMCTKPFWRRWMRAYTLKHATLLLAVSEHTAHKASSIVPNRGIEILYNGVDTNYFKPKGAKENIVLTVASGDNNNIIKLKGLDTFVEVAKYVQDATFVVAGLDEKTKYELSKLAISDNIKLIGKRPQDTLLKLYQRSKVYCQLSKVESFGMSLAEAMACGCIPVVSNCGALPEIIGTEGYIVPSDVKQITLNIKNALSLFPYGDRFACKRIQQNFSIEKRERALVKIIEDV